MMTKALYVSNYSKLFIYLTWQTLHNALGEMWYCYLHFKAEESAVTGQLSNLPKNSLVISPRAEI